MMSTSAWNSTHSIGAFATRRHGLAQPAGGRVQRNFEQRGAAGNEVQRPAAPAEFRVELQGAVDDDEGERRAQAVAVDDDLVGVGLTRDADQFRRRS